MTESAALPPSVPEPSLESGGDASPPSAPGKGSPLGSVWKYRCLPPVPSMMNCINVDGVVVPDTTRNAPLSPDTIESEWASPLAPIRSAFKDYIVALAFYWYTYGAVLALSLFGLNFLYPRGAALDFNTLGLVFFFGPYYGITLNFLMAKSSVLGLPLVATFILVDAGLFYLLLFTDDWGRRVKYGAFMVAFVLGKVLLTAFL